MNERERELEQEAQEHYQTLIDRGVPNALAAALAAQRYGQRLAVANRPQIVVDLETKPAHTRGRRETK